MRGKKAPLGFDVNAFVTDDNAENSEGMSLTIKQSLPMPGTEMIPVKKNTPATVVPTPITSMSYLSENIPYQQAYVDTTKQLDEAIAQLDILSAENMRDMAMVRANKVMKNKYPILGTMTENGIAAINAKISAIREKNSVIKDINHSELQRSKELKLSANNEDDNTRIANLYNAFVNTPIGGGPGVLGPSIQDLTMLNSAGMGGAVPQNNLPYMNIGIPAADGAWEAGLSPSERRMVLDAQGKIETVVMYDEATGNRWYAVLDKTTGQPITGIETPSNDTIYELDINVRGGFAKDSNRATTYPLKVINSNSGMGTGKIDQY